MDYQLKTSAGGCDSGQSSTSFATRPPEARGGLTENQILEANARRLVLLAARPLFAAGLSCVAAARACGVKNLYLWRLLQLVAYGSNFAKSDELLNGPLERLAPAVSPGKGSDFAVLLAVPEIVKEMLLLYKWSMGASSDEATNDRRTGSIAGTLKHLGDCPLVPPHLAQKLQAGRKPKCLVDFIKQAWTAEMEAKERGGKHYNNATICGRRELNHQFADGTEAPLQPGRVWVFDDMSSNIPFWFEVNRAEAAGIADKGLSQLVARHGCALGRQGLYAWDWASGAWLGVEMVGRLRDAYQASDILRFVRKLVMIYGKPDKIIFERGTWEAKSISGWRVKETGEVVELDNGWEMPAMDGDEKAKIEDGIRAIGVQLQHTYTSRGKPIEGAFKYLQTNVPILFRGEAVNIGHYGGEFEWSARQYRRAQNGVGHPAELGFASLDRAAEVTWQAMLWEGRHDKPSRKGKPHDLLRTWLQTSPLPAASERDLAVFLPVVKTSKILGGHLSTEINGEEHDFINEEIFAALGDGVKVQWKFDPAEPRLGAAVYGEKGFLCWAKWWPPAPVTSDRDRSADPGAQIVKNYKLAHRTKFFALNLLTGKTISLVSKRDGTGQTEVETPGMRISTTSNGETTVETPALHGVRSAAAAPPQWDRRASAREVTERILSRPVREAPDQVDVNGWL